MAAGETAGPSTSLRYGPPTPGRDDDNSVAGFTTVSSLLFRSLQNCHRPDREWRDRKRSEVEGPAVFAKSRFVTLSIQVATLSKSNRPPLVIPTGA